MRVGILIRTALGLCSLGLAACDPSDEEFDAGPGPDAPGGGAGVDASGSGDAPSADASTSDSDARIDAGSESFRLEGEWIDSGRRLDIEQSGRTVTGHYIEPLDCDFETGTVPPGEAPAPGAQFDSIMIDFSGELDRGGPEVEPGAIITGEVSTCRFGFAADAGVQNGWEFAPMTLEVVDRNTLSGEWQGDQDGDGEIDGTFPFSVTRL
jgi:hypothetical protein